MARKIKNADGMFPREIVPWGEETDADREQWQKTVNIMCNLDARLAWMTRVIKPLLGELTPEENLVDPASSDERQATAREMHFKIRDLRALIKSGDIDRAVLYGIDIGELGMRLDVLCHESKVVHATKAMRGLGAGREKKSLTTKNRHKEIATAVKSRMQAHPRDSLTYARGIVAEQLGISFNTVRAATTGMKKPSRKKK